MGDFAQFVMPVLGCMVVMLLSLIGFFVQQRMKSIDASLKCLPDIQVELAGMAVKVDQQSTTITEHGKRLGEIEKHISNTERIAVLEKTADTMERELTQNIRPHVHQIANSVSELSGVVQVLVDAAGVKMPHKQTLKPAT